MIQTIEASPDEIYDIELEHSLLEANAKLAKENRSLLDGYGVAAIDVMGAIGAGLTYQDLVSRTVQYQLAEARVLVLELGAVIETKEYADREKDRAVLPVLRQTLAMKARLSEEK